MILSEMTELDAKNICNWKYPGVYSIYNMGDWNSVVQNKWAIADENKRKKQFRTVYNENNELLGYFRFYNVDDKIIIGLGLHPEKCGKGIGKIFLDFILNLDEFKNKLIELEVRSFNERAIKCYQKAGFKIIGKEEKATLIGKDLFTIMQKKNM